MTKQQQAEAKKSLAAYYAGSISASIAADVAAGNVVEVRGGVRIAPSRLGGHSVHCQGCGYSLNTTQGLDAARADAASHSARCSRPPAKRFVQNRKW